MIRLFNACDRGTAGLVYPDGGATLDQPNLLIEAFNVVADAQAQARARRRDKA